MAERRPSAGSSALNAIAQQEQEKKYSLQGRTQVAPRVQTMQNARPTVRSALSNLMRDAVDATGLGGGYRQGLLNVAGGVETAADFLPVVGDVLGLEDASRAYRQGDMVGAGINMMGVVPIVGDAGVKLAKKTRSALRDSGFTEGFFHGTKQDIQDGFKAGYNDGMVFVSPNKEFASNWVGKGKYQERIGEKDLYDMKQSDKQAVWDNYKSQYGDFDNWPEEIVDEWLAKQSAISRQYDASGGAIYPVAVKANNQFDPESNPEIISEFLTRRGQNPLGTTLERGKTDLEVYQEGNYLLFENKEMADFLKDKGYDSVWLREDTTQAGLGKPFSTLAVLDETGVKPVYDFAREADSALSALRGLDMDQGSRMQRAQDLGFDTDNVFYHGAVTDIAEFDLNRGTPESHMGTAVYTTTGTSDASKNYASLEGPDLSNKITRRAEEIIDSGELSEQWADIYRKREVGTRKDVGKARNEARADLMNIAEDIAKEEFNDNLGVVYPLIGRSEKPFDISEGNDTFLSFEYPEFDPKDYLDEADGDMDIAADLARDDSYNFEPEGELTDFLYSIRRNLSDTEYSEVSNAIMESAYDGGISGKELEDIYRKAEIYSDDDLGRLNQMEIFRKGLEDAGFDSIIHDANRFNMDHVEGQKHQIFFKENQLRSPNAEFDPAKVDSADLLSNRQSERQMSALRGIA